MYISKFERSGHLVSTRFLKKDMQEVTVYPNPGSDKIIFSGETQNRTFSLYDMQGRNVTNANNEQLTQGIDVSELVSGIYFYRITNKASGSVKTGKWVKE